MLKKHNDYIRLRAGGLYQYSKLFSTIGRTIEFKFIFLREIDAEVDGHVEIIDDRFEVYNIEQNEKEILNGTIIMRDRVTVIND